MCNSCLNNSKRKQGHILAVPGGRHKGIRDAEAFSTKPRWGTSWIKSYHVTLKKLGRKTFLKSSFWKFLWMRISINNIEKIALL